MRRIPGIIILITLCLRLIFIWSTSGAQLDNTKHDLSYAGNDAFFTGTDDRICVFCHTPHGGNQGLAQLWNRNNSAATYQMYDSPSIDMTVDAQPSGSSLLCLSCHDGVQAASTLAVTPRYNWSPAASGSHLIASGALESGPAFMDTDLRDDHPISVDYDPARDPDFLSVPTSPARLEDSKVQCISCHDPHDDGNGKFLVMSNENSDLCFACHDK
jgi:predicted CXXCH cytochrome family protein